MYINDLPRCLRNAQHHMFADDVQLYHSFYPDQLSYGINRMNEDLDAVSRWAGINSLILNVNKTQAIIFSQKAFVVDPPEILLNGEVIPYSSTVTNLGLIMDSRMIFKNHVEGICSKVFCRLRSL